MTTPRLPNKADPLQGIVFGAIGIASVFGLWTWLNLTADQVGALGGFLLMFMAAVRSAWRIRHNARVRREEDEGKAEPNNEPPASEVDTEDPEEPPKAPKITPPKLGPDGRPYREG